MQSPAAPIESTKPERAPGTLSGSNVTTTAGAGTMNFPCDNCKTIRPFYGQPLRCEVCGWECGASSRDKVLSGFQGQTPALRKEVARTDPETRTDDPDREPA